MSKQSPFEPGVEVRKVRPGWQGVAYDGDGGAVKVWAPTEDEAKRKAQEAFTDE
jgi:hypothetical protein